jgi:chromosome segregation ATPase
MKDVGHSLYMETQAARTLLAQMADILGDDETAKRDAIEGETNLREAIAVAIKQIGEDEAAVLGLSEYVGELSDRRERLKQRIANMRTAICVAMEQAHEKTLETAFATVTTKAVPKTAIITEEADIPSDYWKEQPPKLDKAAVTKALKEGVPVTGAVLSNGGLSISIRRN